MTTTALLATGGYSTSDRGRGPGIALLRLEIRPGGDGPAVTAQTLATVDLPNPSFLLWSPDGNLLHAVLETDPTRVVTLRVSPDGTAAEVIADLPIDGSGGCHLAYGPGGPGGRTLVIAQYGSGSVVTIALDADGVPTAQIDLDDHREGRDRGEDTDPHPHQAVVLPGTDVIAVPDLGLDTVMLYRRAPGGGMDLAGEIVVGRGTGPRHLAADHESQQLHIAGELSGAIVTAHREDDGQQRGTTSLPVSRHRWRVRSVVPASSAEGPNALSHIELTADESHLLVANRGPDSLSLLSLAGMRPSLVAETPVGEHPRHFTQIGDLVLVAAQEADRIDVLRRSEGTLEVAGEPIPLPSVACLTVRP